MNAPGKIARSRPENSRRVVDQFENVDGVAGHRDLDDLSAGDGQRRAIQARTPERPNMMADAMVIVMEARKPNRQTRSARPVAGRARTSRTGSRHVESVVPLRRKLQDTRITRCQSRNGNALSLLMLQIY